MALRHLSSTSAQISARRAGTLGSLRPGSAWLAHLLVMDTHTPDEAAFGEPGDVIGGAFEPAISLKELAAELNVTSQTLYDLRQRGVDRNPQGRSLASPRT